MQNYIGRQEGNRSKDKEDWRRAAPNTSGCGKNKDISRGRQAQSCQAITSHSGGEYLLAGEYVPTGLQDYGSHFYSQSMYLFMRVHSRMEKNVKDICLIDVNTDLSVGSYGQFLLILFCSVFSKFSALSTYQYHG